MLLLLSVGNVLTGGFQLSAQEQSKRFSVKVDNITLKEAIEVIKKQGNYSFLIRNYCCPIKLDNNKNSVIDC